MISHCQKINKNNFIFYFPVKQNPHRDIIMAGALKDAEYLPTATSKDSSESSEENSSSTTTTTTTTTPTTEDSFNLSKADALGVDLGILSACDHVVATFSSFGMWAGNLGSRQFHQHFTCAFFIQKGFKQLFFSYVLAL